MDKLSTKISFVDKKKVWQKILEKIKSQITPHNFRGWFSQAELLDITEEQIIISVPSAFFENQLKARYLALIEDSTEKVTGKKLHIEFKIDLSRLKRADFSEEEEFNLIPTPQTPSTLNPKYTLDNFVVGLTNNVAYAAAQAIVQNPGISYNPLFIYGGTGVGKTHLMIGIGNALSTKNPHFKIIYCSSEKFTNDYVEAIQNRRMGDMRKKYRSADLLLVDDIQFFSGREQTQEEFFHTFNELLSASKQVVLTSDRPPHEIARLEARLQSRFQGGLMVDIQSPDLDTRVAILKAKCSERGESLPEDCLNMIAQSTEGNARELEGKLIQILQFLKINPPEGGVTIEVIRQFFGRQTTSKLNLNHKQVLQTVCNYFDIKNNELIGPRRKKELVLPRHLAMYILSDELNLTVEKIGQILGGRDHTTVMHGRDRIKKLINTDREVQKMYIELKQSLLS